MRLIAHAIMGNRTDVEDVLQDSAITGMKKYLAGEFRAGTNFEAWMGQITRYTALNARRARAGSAATASDAIGVLTPAKITNARDEESDRVLAEAMDALAETPRLCLVLRIVGGLPYSTIARIAEIPEGTAMSHVHRSQNVLRDRLAGRLSVMPGPAAGGARPIGGSR